MTQEHQSHFDSHARSIDDLHAKLAADPHVDTEKLKSAVGTYKKAFAQFQDDAQGCLIPS